MDHRSASRRDQGHAAGGGDNSGPWDVETDHHDARHDDRCPQRDDQGRHEASDQTDCERRARPPGPWFWASPHRFPVQPHRSSSQDDRLRQNPAQPTQPRCFRTTNRASTASDTGTASDTHGIERHGIGHRHGIRKRTIRSRRIRHERDRQHRWVERRGRPLRRVGSGRTAQAAWQPRPEPPAGAGGEEAQEQAEDERGAGDGERAPDEILGRPRHGDGEVRAPECRQVLGRDRPAVGEAVDQFRGTQVDGTCTRRRVRTGLRRRMPALVDALAEHELEGRLGAGDGGRLRVDVARRHGDRRGRAGLRGGQQGRPGGRSGGGRRRLLRLGRNRGRVGRGSIPCRSTVWRRSSGCAPWRSARRGCPVRA